jgi:hypothetical protein
MIWPLPINGKIIQTNMKINTEELYKLYMKWVDQVSEDCDWKTHFTPDEIVHAIARILENNPHLISQNDDK